MTDNVCRGNFLYITLDFFNIGDDETCGRVQDKNAPEWLTSRLYKLHSSNR